MECRVCWFKNPDADFDANYPSDSESAGLVETDHDFDRSVLNDNNNNNNNDNDSKQQQLLNDNTNFNAQSHFTCSKCTIHERKILKVNITKLTNSFS